MLTYKCAFVSPRWTSKVTSRVASDVMRVLALARRDTIRVIVASNRDLSRVLAGMQNVRTTQDLTECNFYRVYVDYTETPEDCEPFESLLPEGVAFEEITVSERPKPVGLKVEKDPYAGINLFKMGQRIPSTWDTIMNAPRPKDTDEPLWSVWI